MAVDARLRPVYDYLAGAEPPPPPASYDGVVTASRLNVRSGPGTQYAVVGGLRYLARVTIHEEAAGWGRVGAGQWVSLRYVRRTT
jgi:uncharacterized protein YraI